MAEILGVEEADDVGDGLGASGTARRDLQLLEAYQTVRRVPAVHDGYAAPVVHADDTLLLRIVRGSVLEIGDRPAHNKNAVG